MSDKQSEAIQKIKQGGNISLVGPGGSGKSWTVDQVKTADTIVVAPSAVAARNVDGCTVHSMFSLSHGIQTQKDLDRITPTMNMLLGENSPLDRIVFDEAYTLPANLLDDVDYKLRKIRRNDLPFGGIQVVLSGDPAQCSPFWSYQEGKILKRKYLSPFIFNSKVWKKADVDVLIFDKIYRNTNAEQQEWLNAIRIKDNYWEDAVQCINNIATIGSHNEDDDLHLCSYNIDADKINEYYYSKIKNPEFTYKASVTGKYKESYYPAPLELKLKVGTKVLFTVNNYEAGFINGMQGTVIELSDELIVVENENGEHIDVEPNEWENTDLNILGGKISKVKVGTFKQYPLRHSWGSSIHSSQGLTLSKATIDFGSQAFAAGMSYVALTRLRSLENLTLVRPIELDDIKVDNKAINFIKKHTND